MTALRLGTRRSPLATAQAGTVAQSLRDLGFDVELVTVVTEGDRNPGALTEIGGTGVFASALRERLLDGGVDFVVHSLKDLPTSEPAGLVIAALPQREDPRDVLVSREGLLLAQLPEGARIGTGSPRRAAQLLAARPDAVAVPVRGNVDSRLRKLADGEFDAIVLAAAGLARLGRLADATEILPTEILLPAAGQGALAVECRADDAAMIEDLSRLDHAATRAAVTAERALLAALEAGCGAPVGALARVGGGESASDELAPDGDSVLHLSAVAAAPDGAKILRHTAAGDPAEPVRLGEVVAAHLLAAGAGTLTATASPSDSSAADRSTLPGSLSRNRS